MIEIPGMNEAGVERAASVPVTGPRHWWGGALDVEGLALGSVGAAAAALNRLLGRRAVTGIDSARVAASFDSPGVLRIDGSPIRAFSELSRFFRTSDGWVRTHGNYPHHAERLLSALGVSAAADVAPALARMGSREAEERIQSAGAIGAAVRTRKEWQASPLAPRTRPEDWVEFVPGSEAPRGVDAPWAPGDTASRPLRGLRVLDLTRTIAGPISARLMAALGADVLRVDPPATPEILAQHIDSDPGKRTAAADLGRPETLARFHELLASAHVLLIGYRTGSLDRFGLSPDALRERHPGVAVVTFNAWGHGTPWERRRGFDSIVQAACGIADRYRAPDGTPGALPVQALDHATGYGIFTATMTLLAARARDGGGSRARLALASTADLLFGLSGSGGAREPVREVPPLTADSGYGPIEYAPPPFDLAGDGTDPEKPLDYPFAPREYGADPLEWREE